MKKSKLRRGLTVFLVILGVLSVLFGCLFPLFFQRDERVSASAAAKSIVSFNITFSPNSVTGDILDSAYLYYTDLIGNRKNVSMIVNSINTYLSADRLSLNPDRLVQVVLNFKNNNVIKSVTFDDDTSGAAISSFSDGEFSIDVSNFEGASVGLVVSIEGGAPVAPHWDTGGVIFDSNSVKVSDYITSASLVYFDSSEAPIPAVKEFQDQVDGSMLTTASVIYLKGGVYPRIEVRTTYGVVLSRVSVVVGSGGIDGTNFGGVTASVVPVQGESRYYYINLSIDPSNINLMFLYLIPTFAGTPNPDAGYDAGYDDGYEDGYDNGYDSGRLDGYDEGYEAGNVNASQQYNKGYNTGYNDGYSLGLAAGQNTTWESLNVVSLFLSPVNSFLATPLFGSFSIGTAFSVVLVVLLAGIFIKMFAGG